jgi:phospholipid/cholesterol/gamma-HCH transport system ATP-binding protein
MDTPLLEFREVTMQDEETVFLDNFSLSMSRGENIVVFGLEKSGINKLVPLILNLHEEFTGEVLFIGKRLRGMDYLERAAYRNKIGYLHSGYGLFSNMSVEQNIALPLEYHSEKNPEEIAGSVNRMMRSLGISGSSSLRPVDLSESENLRTAYGRAIMLDPDLLVLEHALLGQSALNIKSLLEKIKIRALQPDRSLLAVTYNPEIFLDFTDTFIMLFNGTVVFAGTRDDFLHSGNPYVNQYRSNSLDGPMEIT